MSNEGSSEDSFEEDDTFTLFRHFRHNAIINEEDEEESDVNSKEQNEERCKNQEPTRTVELLTMDKAASELSTTADFESKTFCSYKKDTFNSQKKFRQRKLAVGCYNMETENEETSLERAKQVNSLAISKLSIEGSRPLRNKMFIRNGEQEKTYEVNGKYNNQTGKTTVLKCDQEAEKTKWCSKIIRLPFINEAKTQLAHQNKTKQTSSNSLVESTYEKRNGCVSENQDIKPSRDDFSVIKTQKFALENSDNISFLYSEATRSQKEQMETLDRLKWKIYESNMQKKAAKEGEKTYFRKKAGIPVRRSVHRIPIVANGCQGIMLMKDIGLKRRERSKSYPSRHNQFENSAHFLRFIREENELSERSCPLKIEQEKDLSEAENKHILIEARLTNPGTEIGCTNLANSENEKYFDISASGDILEGKVSQTSLVDRNGEKRRIMYESVKDTDEDGETKMSLEVGFVNDTGWPCNCKHTRSEQHRQDSESSISRLLYRSRSESDKLRDKIKKFLKKPSPQTPSSSLRIIKKTTAVAPEGGLGKLSELKILPVVKRDKTQGVVNLQTCPSLNAFIDRSWQYQDKLKCRYIRSMPTPIPPVEDVFRDLKN